MQQKIRLAEHYWFELMIMLPELKASLAENENKKADEKT